VSWCLDVLFAFPFMLLHVRLTRYTMSECNILGCMFVGEYMYLYIHRSFRVRVEFSSACFKTPKQPHNFHFHML